MAGGFLRPCFPLCYDKDIKADTLPPTRLTAEASRPHQASEHAAWPS
nr:MAG TPA: hypothetical protein [Caudoviricetes sp.]